MKVRRMIIPVSICYAVSIILSWYLREYSSILLLVGACLAAIPAIFLLSGYRRLVVVLIFTLGVGLVNSSARVTIKESRVSIDDVSIKYCTVDERISINESYCEYTVKAAEEGVNNKYNGKILLRIYGDNAEYGAGDVLCINNGVLLEGIDINNDPFSRDAYLEREEMYYTAYVNSDELFLMYHNAHTLSHYIEGYREKIVEDMYASLSEDAASVLNATVVGETIFMEGELREGFSRTGTAHIFAISGLHVGFFLTVTGWITLFMKNRPGLRNTVRILLTIVYVIFTGASVSALRALIFAVLYLGCRRRGLRGDSSMVICTAACIILLISPFDLFSVGFILSFSAVLGISLLSGVARRIIYKIYRGENRIFRKIIDGFSVSVGAQIGVMLPMALFFNVFSPSAFITNIAVIPITSVVYVIGFVVNLFNAVASYIPQALVFAVEILVYILTASVKWVSALPFAQITVATPSLLLCIAFCITVYLISPERPRWLIRGNGYACLAMLPVIICLAVIPYATVRDSFITYTSRGENTSTLTAISPHGSVVVVYNGEDINDKTVEALKRHNGGVIDVLVIFDDVQIGYNIWARDIKNVYICNSTDETYDKAIESGALINYLDGRDYYKGKGEEFVYLNREDNTAYVKMEGNGKVLSVRLENNELTVID